MWDKWNEVSKLPLEESSTKGFKPVPVSEEEINEGEYAEAFPNSLEPQETEAAGTRQDRFDRKYTSEQISALAGDILEIIDGPDNDKTISELCEERGISRASYNRYAKVIAPDRIHITKSGKPKRDRGDLDPLVIATQKDLDQNPNLSVFQACKKYEIKTGNFYYKRKMLWPERFGAPYGKTPSKKIIKPGRPRNQKEKQPRYIDLEITPEPDEIKLVTKEKLFSFQGTKAELIKFCTLVLDLESAR